MDAATIRAALAGLEGRLERAREAKRQIEGISNEGYEYPEAAFEAFLVDVFETLLVVLEAAGLPEARSRLITRWDEFQKNGIRPRACQPEYDDYPESPPFEYVKSLIESLRISAGEGLKPSDSYELIKLETILRKTPVLLRKRGVIPQGELDVQNVMRDYLEAFFTEYTPEVRIPGIIQSFKPDCGVRNLRTAIEFKYAANRTEVARAIRGVFEDLGGYSGSRDWTNFYTLIYQTEPFESEERVRSELLRTGTLTWKALLVNGAGLRRNRRKAGSKVPARDAITAKG